MARQPCIFCRIAQGDAPVEAVYDDERTLAFKDINPVAPVHLLIIPREHVGALTDADDAQLAAVARCLAVAPRIAEQEGLAASGYRLVANQGAHAGQIVDHFHLHLLGGRQLGELG